MAYRYLATKSGKNMLNDLKAYLTQSGWKIEPTKGAYEVLRAVNKQYPRPLLVYDRTSGGCGYSIDERDLKIYNGWRRNRTKRGLNPNYETAEEREEYWLQK